MTFWGTVVEHAFQAHPEECCGLLIGKDEVTRAVPAQNVAADRRAGYALDPAFHLSQELEARSRGERVLGIYHSHPHGPASPSLRDRREADPGYLYLIVGMNHG